jgi:hypothetical protein
MGRSITIGQTGDCNDGEQLAKERVSHIHSIRIGRPLGSEVVLLQQAVTTVWCRGPVILDNRRDGESNTERYSQKHAASNATNALSRNELNDKYVVRDI